MARKSEVIAVSGSREERAYPNTTVLPLPLVPAWRPLGALPKLLPSRVGKVAGIVLKWLAVQLDWNQQDSGVKVS